MRVIILCISLAGAVFAQVSDPAQIFREAVEAQQRGDDALAIRKYQELLKLRPDVVEVRANLGAALAHAGRLDQAIVEYRAALKQAPTNTALRFNLALAYYKKGDVSNAVDEFRILHEADPTNLRIVTLLADCYARLGRDTEAIALLTPLEAAHPDDLDVAWALGAALIHAGHLRDGLTRVETVAKARDSAEAWMLAAGTALRLNEFERARQDVDAALRLNPQLPGLYTLDGKILEDLGDNEGAIEALRRALARNPDDFEAHLDLGAALNAQRDLRGARLHIERALALKPSSPQARFEEARLERAEGQLHAAVKHMEKVVDDEPDWLQPHIELAALYYRVKRPQDGARERAIVDRLTAEEQQRELRSLAAPAPSH